MELALKYKNGAPSHSMRMDDLHKHSVNVRPSASDGGDLVKLLDKHEGHVANISNGISRGSPAKQFVAVLTAKSREWPIAYLREGDVLKHLDTLIPSSYAE